MHKEWLVKGCSYSNLISGFSCIS
uniref:Uncharacterized protein n=1 Tax=Arundo donax TaxID=35708 RepID=A0A0A9HW91_ARUDO